MVIDEIIESPTLSSQGESETLENVREFLNIIFWRWFQENLNRKLTTIKLFGIFKKSIYVRDLRDIFTLLFGPQNGLSAGSIS